MVNGERGKSFSSPNDNRRVWSIKEGAGGKQIEIVLADGSSFFVRGPCFLEEGDYVSDRCMEALTDETIALAAKEKALEYLARREHSRYELKRKLLLKDFPEKQIERVLDECEEAGYLDDQRFAELWVESRLRKRTEGPLRVAAALYKKGVPRDIVEKVINEVFTDERLSFALRAAEEKGLEKYGNDEGKVRRYLFSRGFTMEQINSLKR